MDFFAGKSRKKVAWNRRIGIYQQSLPMVEQKTLIELWFNQIALAEGAQTDLCKDNIDGVQSAHCYKPSMVI
jgi:hypothetical protein